MSGELSNLVVRLSLQDTDFQRGLANTNRAARTLQSEFRAISQGMGGFSNAMEQSRARADVLNRMIDTQRNKIEQLRERYEQSRTSQGENATATQRWAMQLNRAVQDLNRFEQELHQVNGQIDQQSNRMLNLGNRMQSFGNNLQNAGMQIGVVFGGMAYAMGRGLKSAVEESMNFEQQMANIKAVSGATGDEMNKMSKLAIDMGAKTKYSSVEAGKGIEELIKAGVGLKDIINGGLEGALNLATAGELELGEAAEIASTALNAFKADHLSVTDAANLLAGAANASATNVQEMKLGLSSVATVAAGVGMSFKDTSTTLAAFAQSGLKSSDAGTSLKTMLLNLQPSTKEATTLMKELGLYSDETGSVFYDATGKIKPMADIAELLKTKMSNLTDAQRSQALQTMFGTDAIRAANILYEQGANGINKMYSEMSKVTAADVAATKMNTLKGQMEQLSGAFDTAKKTIGDALAPAVGMVVKGLQSLVDGFNNLSPGMQKFIAISGAVVAGLLATVAVVGVVLASVGAVTAGIGALATSLGIAGGITGLAGAAVGVLGSALGVLLGPVGLIAVAVGVTGVAAYKAYKKATEDSIESVDRFAKNTEGKVSSSTKKVLGDYFKLSDGIKQKLTEIRINHETITAEQAQKMGQQYDEMTKKITQKIDERKQKETETLKKLFSDSYVLTNEEENKRIELMQQKHEEEKQKTIQKNNQIKAIFQQAANENRELTRNERVQIQALQDEMDHTAVQHMTQNQMEQKVIYENMRQQASELSARQAAEVVQHSAQARDKVIEDAKKTKNDKIAEIIRQRDETKTISADEANSMIAEANRQYDSTVSTARDRHNQIVNEAKAQAGEHANQVNWETGEIKSKYQAMKDDVLNKMSDIWSGVTRKWDDLKKSASDKMNDIKNDVSRKWGEVERFFSSIDLKSIGSSIIEGLGRGIDNASGGLFSKAAGIASQIKETIAGALQVNSPSKVMIPIGGAVPEGLALGMSKNVKYVLDAANDMAQAAVPNIPDIPYNQQSRVNGATFNSAIAQQRPIEVHIHNPKEASIAEISREQRKIFTDLAFQMGGALF
ncbi:phage tail tape measure protein [Bacillus cytotoxicus]|uniref:Phage tail tape measure protein n=1 Tax=Bacillus cytotoxicus TaxID=580165 RepID=A0ACC6A6B5_9BACI|nr:phage tail tape measure protein [Bacillus cytotoxicus]